MKILDDRLYSYRKPEIFLSIAKKYNHIPNTHYFNDPACQKVREAWVGGRLALGLKGIYSSIEVRLIPEGEFPDFDLLIAGKPHRFETTVVYDPRREVGQEYRERERKPHQPRLCRPSLGQDEGPQWIAKGVEKKQQRRYSEPPHLLVYASFYADDLDPTRLARSCQRWSASFSSMWILWRLKYLLLYDNDNSFGEVNFRVWLPVKDEAT